MLGLRLENGELSSFELLEREGFVRAEQDGIFSFSLLRVVCPTQRQAEFLAARLDGVFDPATRCQPSGSCAGSSSSRVGGRSGFRLFGVHVWHGVLTLSEEDQADLSVKPRVHVVILSTRKMDVSPDRSDDAIWQWSPHLQSVRLAIPFVAPVTGGTGIGFGSFLGFLLSQTSPLHGIADFKIALAFEHMVSEQDRPAVRMQIDAMAGTRLY